MSELNFDLMSRDELAHYNIVAHRDTLILSYKLEENDEEKR